MHPGCGSGTLTGVGASTVCECQWARSEVSRTPASRGSLSELWVLTLPGSLARQPREATSASQLDSEPRRVCVVPVAGTPARAARTSADMIAGQWRCHPILKPSPPGCLTCECWRVSEWSGSTVRSRRTV